MGVARIGSQCEFTMLLSKMKLCFGFLIMEGSLRSRVLRGVLLVWCMLTQWDSPALGRSLL